MRYWGLERVGWCSGDDGDGNWKWGWVRALGEVGRG